MKKQILLSFLCFCTLFTFAQQHTKLNNIAFAEKIYLQLNSSVFTGDQTIWFTSIVTNVNQKKSALSKVLHVELVNFDQKIVASKILKLKDGVAHNFFNLEEVRPLPEGKYMIRAYTKWNTNFDEHFISKQYIDIYDPRTIDKKYQPIRNIIITENKDQQLQLSANIFPKTINPKFSGKLKVNLSIDGKKDSVVLKRGKEDLQAGVSMVDCLGRFSFNLKDIYNNELEYLIQTQNKKGKNREYRVKVNKPKAIPVTFEQKEKLQLVDQYKTYVKENRKRYAKLNPFDVGKNGFVLDEVKIKTRLLSPIQEKITHKHGEPEVVIENKEFKAKNERWMSGLYSLLEYKYPNDIKIFDVALSDPSNLGNDNQDSSEDNNEDNG